MAGYSLDASWLAGGPHLSDFFSDIFAQPDYDPAGLAVSMAGVDATLTWYDSPASEGVTSYYLYRRTPPTGALFVPGSDTPIATGVTSPYVDAGLAAGTYEWEVIGAVITSPYSGFTGYFAEYDASNAASLSGSPTLTAWNDLSGNGYHLATATGSPTTGSRTIGGLNAIDFASARMSVDIPDQAQPLTVYFVVQSDVTSDSSPTKYEFLGGDPAFGGTNMGHIFDEWVADNLESFIGVDGTAHIVGAVYDGAGSVIWVDSTEVTGNPGSGGLNKIHIGSRGNDAAAFDGAIGHVLVYTAAHDATERAAVRTALQAQWSTP